MEGKQSLETHNNKLRRQEKERGMLKKALHQISNRTECNMLSLRIKILGAHKY